MKPVHTDNQLYRRSNRNLRNSRRQRNNNNHKRSLNIPPSTPSPTHPQALSSNPQHNPQPNNRLLRSPLLHQFPRTLCPALHFLPPERQKHRKNERQIQRLQTTRSLHRARALPETHPAALSSHAEYAEPGVLSFESGEGNGGELGNVAYEEDAG